MLRADAQVVLGGASANNATGATGNVVPGVIWDNTPNSGNNGIAGLGVAYDLASTTPSGPTGNAAMMWLTAYSPKNGTNNVDPTNTGLAPVRSYSSGSVMSGVFWSAENSRYFIAPAGQNASLRTDYYKTAQGYTPTGASTLGDVNVMGQFSPVIPQHGATAQYNTLAAKRPTPNWQGGVYRVGLYVDGNPYTDNGQPGAVYVGNNAYARVDAGKYNVFNTFIDVEGNAYAAKQIVVGTNSNGPQSSGYQIYNGVKAGIDSNSQTAIRNGHIELPRGNGLAIPGHPCGPGYEGVYHTDETKGFTAHSAAAGDYGALLICSWNNRDAWTWSKNVSRLPVTTYRLPDGCGTSFGGGPITACEVDIGLHQFCAMNEGLGNGYNADVVAANSGFLAGPNGHGGNYANAQRLVQIIEQFINTVRVTPQGCYDSRGYQDWHMWRGGTLD